MEDIDGEQAEGHGDNVPLAALQLELKTIGRQTGDEDQHGKGGHAFQLENPLRQDPGDKNITKKDDDNDELIAGLIAQKCKRREEDEGKCRVDNRNEHPGMNPGGTKGDNGPEIIANGGNDQDIGFELHSARGIKKNRYNEEEKEGDEEAQKDPRHQGQSQKTVFRTLEKIFRHIVWNFTTLPGNN